MVTIVWKESKGTAKAATKLAEQRLLPSDAVMKHWREKLR